MAASSLIPVGFKFYKDEISAVATEFGLEPALVAAIVWQESSFCADAFRFEPDFWNRYLKKNPKYLHLNPRRVSASYGLMQIMYPLVHEDKLADKDALPPEHLFDPAKNLITGCRHLRLLLGWALSKTAQDTDLALRAALASYNGGRGGNDPSKDSPLRNGGYAREVLAKAVIMRRAYGV
jgi:soluble lytic murein transglycosylase-like protein